MVYVWILFLFVASIVVGLFLFSIYVARTENRLIDRLFKVFVIFSANCYALQFLSATTMLLVELPSGFKDLDPQVGKVISLIWLGIFLAGWIAFWGWNFLKSRKKSKTR